MVKIALECINCKSTNIIKAGRNKSLSNPIGTQRYRCKDCGKIFQKDYKHLAWKPEVKEKIMVLSQTLSIAIHFLRLVFSRYNYPAMA